MMAPFTTTSDATSPTCSPADRVTKSLLGYGVFAGPFYVTVALAQALTRDGFDLSRHAWSLLANGELGWIQITNFIVTGLMVIAFAVGLDRVFHVREDTIPLSPGASGLRRRRPARALQAGAAATWAPRLIGVFGASMIAAGVFRADPIAGFPVGTPDGAAALSWHGLLHFAAGGIGFTCLAIACLLLAMRYRAEHRPGYAAFSAVTGIVFLIGFVAMSASGGAPFGTLAFVGAVVLVWTWMTLVAIDRYREVATGSR